MKNINYLYFGIFFILLAIMSASGISVKNDSLDTKAFFFLYAVGQAFFEITLLTCLGLAFQHFTNNKIFLAFIGATFILFGLQVIDFLLEKMLNRSVWEAFSIVFSETLSNFVSLLKATGISIWVWILLYLIFGLLPLIGIAFYKATEYITNKKPLSLRLGSLSITTLCLPLALLIWDFSASPFIHPNTYRSFVQSLPLKGTLLHPKQMAIQTPYLLSLPPSEESVAKTIQENQTVLTDKPNIYIFIIESFRNDFITKEGSPNFFAFKESSAPIGMTLSNANSSPPSWFSIFFSQFSHRWHQHQENRWKMGSPALGLLKKMGYQIHLYSSASLQYYAMGKLLFGEDSSLLATDRKFLHIPPITAAETDTLGLKTMQEDLLQNPSLQKGQVFIFFWDTTHFDYTWPKSWIPKFLPVTNKIAHFQLFYSQNRINKIKNRYRNAVHYVDHLFGSFLEQIPKKEEAIIIVSGDHGEEFFEKGHIFHGSFLVQEQTRVPIMMKFGSKALDEKIALATQMDIFPSIFDYLCKEIPPFLEGESVFNPSKNSYAVISRSFYGRTPYEFCIHNGKNKLIAEFSNRGNIFRSNAMNVLSLQSADDQNLPREAMNQAWINEEFGPAIDHLFNLPNVIQNLGDRRD